MLANISMRRESLSLAAANRLSQLFGLVKLSVQLASGFVSPEGTAYCSDGCKPVVAGTNASVKP